MTKHYKAWFTSTRGVYQVCLGRALTNEFTQVECLSCSVTILLYSGLMRVHWFRNIYCRYHPPFCNIVLAKDSSSYVLLLLCFNFCIVIQLGRRSSCDLSKRPSIIKLDSLLQEVCIWSVLAGHSPMSLLRLSVCLVQSLSFFIQD